MALVSFLARPKPRIPFLGLSLLRNQTETLAMQASYHTSLDHTNRVRNKQKWNDVYNPEKILTLLYVREKISNSRDLGKKFLLAGLPKLNHPYPPPPQNSQVFIMWWFSRLKFCISGLNKYADKDTNGKTKFKRMLSFLFVHKRELFVMKLSFEELCYY